MVHEFIGLRHSYDDINCITLIKRFYDSKLNLQFSLPEYPLSKHWIKEFTTVSIDNWAAQCAKKVSLTNGTPQEILNKIYKKGYFKLYIDGGRTVQNFLKEDLIDELRITTIPILLGGGFALFGDLPKPMELEHIESKVFLNQIVQDCYQRKKK